MAQRLVEIPAAHLDNEAIHNEANRIGGGGFSCVYSASYLGFKVAVKRWFDPTRDREGASDRPSSPALPRVTKSLYGFTLVWYVSLINNS